MKEFLKMLIGEDVQLSEIMDAVKMFAILLAMLSAVTLIEKL
jgi:hypothetical protein